MASSADTKAQQDVRRSLRDRADDAQTGTHLMVAGTFCSRKEGADLRQGIVLQLVVLLAFSAIGLDMLRRGRKHPVEPQPGLNLRRLAIGMIVADLALIVRGIYRTAELVRHEPLSVLTCAGRGLDRARRDRFERILTTQLPHHA